MKSPGKRKPKGAQTLFFVTAILLCSNTNAFGQWKSDAANQTLWTEFADPKVGIALTKPIGRVHALSNGLPSFLADGLMDFAVPVKSAIEFGQWDGKSFLERMRIQADGKVGLGTDAPNAALHIAGLGVSDGVRIEGSSNTTQVRLYLDNTHQEGGRNYILQSTAGNVPAGSGKFVIRDADADENRFAIDSDGRIGLGTTTPAARMHLYGESTTTLLVATDGGGIADYARLQLATKGNRTDLVNSPNTKGWSVVGYGDGYGNSDFRNDLSVDFYDAMAKTDIIHFEKDGDIGIGTDNPMGTIDISAGNRNIILRLEDAPSVPFVPNARSSWIDFRHGGDTKGLIESNEDEGALTFYAGNSLTRTMTVKEGKVGIGTDSPDAKLQVVNGSIKAVNGDIRVEAGSFIDDGTTLKSPDYVFESEYELESIEEHGEFMWREKHLPAVKSAREIQGSGGYDMGERREQLLEELEKAHIYIEQLHNRLKALEVKLSLREP